ncbi:MAG: MmgE/PrpD family protein [Chloroflexi bacterium]|nr:MmgE/PrpD family protein [Chloroflexota bacterium]
MDLACELARYAVNLTYDAIPADALEATKKDILDTLGTALAGSGAAGCREVVELVKEWGGRRDATVIAYGGRVPPPSAALANAIMAHALDFDDTHDGAILHAGVPVVPAAFAIAERRGDVAGKEFLTAVTLGIDVACRLGLSAPPAGLSRPGFTRTTTVAWFSSAITAGKLLRLTEEQMVNAIGIAYAQVAGNRQCIPDGALTKRLQPALASRGGVTAAQMAARGVTGAKNSFEGVMGYFRLYCRDVYDREAAVSGLGQRFEGVNLGFKPYPSCRFTHGFIDAALALRDRLAGKLDAITEIRAVIGQESLQRDLVEPLEVKQRPRTIVDAQFSIPYTVATALVKGAVVMSDFTDAAIRDERVLAVSTRVRPRVEPDLMAQRLPPSILEVALDGATLTQRIDYPFGDPQNPMSPEALARKFRDCASHSVRRIPRSRIERAIDVVAHMEKVDDAGAVIRALG